LVATDRDAAVAVAPALITSDATPRLNRPAELLASTEAVGAAGLQEEFERRLSPSLVLGNLWDAGPVQAPGTTLDAGTAEALVTATMPAAAAAGARSVCWLHVSDRDSALAGALRRAGFRRGRFGACAEIDAAGCDSLDHYLARVGRKQRGTIRRDLRD